MQLGGGFAGWQWGLLGVLVVIGGAGCFGNATPVDAATDTSSDDSATPTNGSQSSNPTTAPADTENLSTGVADADTAAAGSSGGTTEVSASSGTAEGTASGDTTDDRAGSSSDSSTGSGLANCGGTFSTRPNPPQTGQDLMVFYESDIAYTNVDVRLDGDSAGEVSVGGGGPFTYSVQFSGAIVPEGPAILEFIADDVGGEPAIIEACQLDY